MKAAPVGELVAKWNHRREEAKKLSTIAPLERVCDEVLADLDSLDDKLSAESLTLTQAAAESGFSADTIGRMIREGHIENVERKHAQRVRRCDLPRKAGHLREAHDRIKLMPNKAAIARAIVSTEEG